MPVAYAALDPALAHPVAGVRFAAVQAGVRKANRYDLLLAQFDEGTAVGGVFTQSRFAAAPVQVCREHLLVGSAIRALVVNTGIANAATGELGLTNARASCASVATVLGVAANQVLPFSTGVILEHLPMDRISAGINAAAAEIKAGKLAAWDRVAQTIMTTDTVYKLASAQATVGGKTVNVTGIAKGAGMIQPNMATMLSFIFTDVAIDGALLQPLARRVADRSFNRVTVDGDTSTNDSYIIAATGKAGNATITSLDSTDAAALIAALEKVSLTLAQAIVRDGEGATKFMTIAVSGGRDPAECDRIARAVAHSPLVKTAFFASDPNLGRILAAVGYGAPADLDPSKVTVHLNDVLVAERGGRAASYREEDGALTMKNHDITVAIDLGRGNASQTVYTCDFSYDYVKINAEYRS
ncbi:MAG: bifunctional glutamate N-acetyltransferase/amino-acid acetyltransferase ArgJ [Burkholderiales bacterium]|uniref:bifunctional glutamate N-acetyltransferase/amino-acid acetyltransferase ArgJ n=1 Tax=Casimicrobium huifangae TaxID=2591109 RepID=UPI0012EB53C3|nr:bifunctional glutamate N-acetyltransferase/amino-acid acetyltransferase ArgJ [Casimicrobium huifangae]